MNHAMREAAPRKTEAEIRSALEQFLQHGGRITRLPDQVVEPANAVRFMPGTYSERLDAPPVIYRRAEVPEAQMASAS